MQNLRGVYESIDFRPNRRLVQWTWERTARIVLSQLSEDAVKRTSKAETAADNQTQSMERCYSTLIDTDLLEKEHNHTQIDYQCIPDSRSVEIDDFTFRGKVEEIQEKADIKAVVSHEKSLPWCTLSSDQIMAPFADLELVAFCSKHKVDIQTASDAKLNGTLVTDGDTVLFDRATNTGYLCVSVIDTMVLGQPLKVERTKNGRHMFRLNLEPSTKKLHPLFVMDASTQMAGTVTFESSLVTALQCNGEKNIEGITKGLMLSMRHAKPARLLVVKARDCFRPLGVTALRAVCRRYYKDIPLNLPLYQTLWHMLKAALKDEAEGEEDMLNIMRLRLLDDSECLALYLQCEGADEVFEPEEMEEMVEEERKACEKKLQMKEYARSFEGARKEFFKPKVPKNKTARSHPLYGFPGGRELPPDDVMETSRANLLKPPGAFIWRGNPKTGDPKSGAWHSHYKPYPRFSRSWVAAGTERNALREVLAHVWSLWLRDNFLEEKDCPVAGIFTGEGLDVGG